MTLLIISEVPKCQRMEDWAGERSARRVVRSGDDELEIIAQSTGVTVQFQRNIEELLWYQGGSPRDTSIKFSKIKLSAGKTPERFGCELSSSPLKEDRLIVDCKNHRTE